MKILRWRSHQGFFTRIFLEFGVNIMWFCWAKLSILSLFHIFWSPQPLNIQYPSLVVNTDKYSSLLLVLWRQKTWNNGHYLLTNWPNVRKTPNIRQKTNISIRTNLAISVLAEYSAELFRRIFVRNRIRFNTDSDMCTTIMRFNLHHRGALHAGLWRSHQRQWNIIH